MALWVAGRGPDYCAPQLFKHATDGVAVVAIVVTLRLDIRSLHVEAVHLGIIVPRSRPEVAAEALTARGAIVE